MAWTRAAHSPWQPSPRADRPQLEPLASHQSLVDTAETADTPVTSPGLAGSY